MKFEINNIKRKITFAQCDDSCIQCRTLCTNIQLVKSIIIVFLFLFFHFKSVQFFVYSLVGSLVATSNLQTINIVYLQSTLATQQNDDDDDDHYRLQQKNKRNKNSETSHKRTKSNIEHVHRESMNSYFRIRKKKWNEREMMAQRTRCRSGMELNVIDIATAIRHFKYFHVDMQFHSFHLTLKWIATKKKKITLFLLLFSPLFLFPWMF